MMDSFTANATPAQPYSREDTAYCNRCPYRPQRDASPRCLLLYPMPDAFAFWLWEDSRTAQNMPGWLIPDGFRLHCRMKAQPQQLFAEEDSFTAVQTGADVCTCAGRNAQGQAVCMATLEVAYPYYRQKAGAYQSAVIAAPDEDVIRRMALCRRGELLEVFHDVAQYRGTGVAAALFHEAKVCEVIAYLVETLAAPQTARAAESGRCGEDQLGLAKVVAYLGAHLQEEFSLDSLCQIACMGKTKLKRSFRDTYRCTLTDFLKQQRIQEAKQLLRETDLPIAAVARATGYVAGGRFAVFFRQMTGYLPSEYRCFFR